MLFYVDLIMILFVAKLWRIGEASVKEHLIIVYLQRAGVKF